MKCDSSNSPVDAALMPVAALLADADADVKAAAASVKAQLPHLPTVGIILGSGLGAAGQFAMQQGAIAIDYADIPDMPQPAVAGHAGRLISGKGTLAGTLLLQGRVHYYEGHSADGITFATRLLAELGVRTLIVSNAAGGITSGYSPGDLMLINGHWTWLDVQQSTLGSIGLRGVPQGRLWSEDLRRLAASIPTSLTNHEGVYAMNSGPNYEPPAEVRMLKRLGVDAVGMSTVPEALAAAARGLRVLGVSCITNVASGLSDQPLNHAEVGQTAAVIEAAFTAWLFSLLDVLQRDASSHRVTTNSPC